ncbi:phage tail tip fiber protein, partial [Pseudomonas viridiflava]
LTQNNIPYAAGFGLGLESGAAGTTSQFVVRADTFLVMNTSSQLPQSFFGITGGQTFIQSAFIQDGTITNAKIGSYISSTNYLAGQSGWILNKNGTLEINGMVAGGGRLVIT